MKAVKFFWILSIMLLLGVMLFVYADADPAVGFSGVSLEKHLFFYYGIALMVLANGALLALAHSFPFFPRPWLKMPNKSYWMQDKEHAGIFYGRAKEWVRGFALLFNLFLGVSFAAIGYANHSNAQTPIAIILFLLGIASVVWLFAFFPIFSKAE